jgi:hypothetical protein
MPAKSETATKGRVLPSGASLLAGVALALVVGVVGGRLAVAGLASRAAASLHAAIDRPISPPLAEAGFGAPDAHAEEEPLDVRFAEGPQTMDDPRLALRPRERRVAPPDPGRLALFPARSETGQDFGTLEKKPVPKGIFIPAATIVRFAKRANVQGTPVATGIEVHGASALGVADGDVLTHVDGQKVASVADATAIVLRAIGAGRSSVSGTLARGEATYPITVEIPASVSGKKPAKECACEGA